MIPEFFELLRERQMRELQAEGTAYAAWLEASRALRLYATIGSEAVLHPDGTVVVYDHVRALASRDGLSGVLRPRMGRDAETAYAAGAFEWEPWGTQLRVGAPMPRRFRPALHVRSARLGRSVKIEHLIGDPPIPLRASTHHIRIYHDADRVWEHTDELVLTLSIPEVVADAVRQLVMAWSDPSTSPEEIS
ncbi:MAG TPA: hypothetical protein VNV25_10185 [Gemmatimonadaceae bacterium]|nr:hypothetical protein [Gemmatimonadaceae bacterium]